MKYTTVKELIDKLKQYSDDMPVGISYEVQGEIETNIQTMESEHGYFEPFEYVNLE